MAQPAEFVAQCPWCARVHIIATVRCGVFVCGNDSGMPNSIVERALSARLSQHATEATLAVVRARVPPVGCFRQFAVASPGWDARRMQNDRAV